METIPGHDDTLDTDSDGIPDGCDLIDDSGYDVSIWLNSGWINSCVRMVQ